MDINLHLVWYRFTSMPRYCKQTGKKCLRSFLSGKKKTVIFQFLLLLEYLSAWPHELLFKQGKAAHTTSVVLTAAPDVIFNWWPSSFWQHFKTFLQKMCPSIFYPRPNKKGILYKPAICRKKNLKHLQFFSLHCVSFPDWKSVVQWFSSGESRILGSRTLGLNYQICHWFAVWPWTSHLKGNT